MKKVLMAGVALMALGSVAHACNETNGRCEQLDWLSGTSIEIQLVPLGSSDNTSAPAAPSPAPIQDGGLSQKSAPSKPVVNPNLDPHFRTQPNLVLVCEAMSQDRTRITVQIVPSEGVVRIGNDTLPITKTMMSQTLARNEFGHEVVVPYIAFVWSNRFMLNNADKAGAIVGGSATVNYGNGLFKCIG